ncbi:MAG: transcription-repair coupling factor, partial [Acidimicrobiales bacterium]
MSDGVLAPLVGLLERHPALDDLLARRSPAVAVPQAAQPVVLAALADQSERRPIVVVVATTSDAERLTGDLAAYVGESGVAQLPAWETLPFERVSPTVETMGQRSKVMSQLRRDDGPAIVVAPIRALIQRVPPTVSEIAPLVIGVGDQIDPHDVIEHLVNWGYRRDAQVEHRGDVALRGSILDIYPSTEGAPIR